METSVFDDFVKRENIKYETADKCLLIILHYWSFKLYSRNDQITFNINSEKSMMTMSETSSGKNIFFLGRRFIIHFRPLLGALIDISKQFPKTFDVLYAHAISNNFKDFFEELNKVLPQITEDSNSTRQSNEVPDFYENNKDLIEEKDDYLESGPYCPACQESPCMCSDPQLRWD
jgi:hypothetical protein